MDLGRAIAGLQLPTKGVGNCPVAMRTLRYASRAQLPALRSASSSRSCSSPVTPRLSRRCSPSASASFRAGDDVDFRARAEWDGFRVVVFRDGGGAACSRAATRSRSIATSPEVVATPDGARSPERCVLDGEIVVAKGTALDVEALQLRVHPAASRARLLAQEIPASVVFWDLLCEGDRGPSRDLVPRAPRLSCKRARQRSAPSVHVTPATSDRALAADWFQRFEGAGLDQASWPKAAWAVATSQASASCSR